MEIAKLEWGEAMTEGEKAGRWALVCLLVVLVATWWTVACIAWVHIKKWFL